jgi:hypothetical protein
VRRLFGKLFGDRGYLSQPLAEQLLVEFGVSERRACVLVAANRSSVQSQPRRGTVAALVERIARLAPGIPAMAPVGSGLCCVEKGGSQSQAGPAPLTTGAATCANRGAADMALPTPGRPVPHSASRRRWASGSSVLVGSLR